MFKPLNEVPAPKFAMKDRVRVSYEDGGVLGGQMVVFHANVCGVQLSFDADENMGNPYWVYTVVEDDGTGSDMWPEQQMEKID